MTTSNTLYTAALSAALLLQFAACPASASIAIKSHNHRLAFIPHHHRHSAASPCSQLASTAADVDDDGTAGSSSSAADPESILQSRNRLLALSTSLANNSPSGKVFIRRPSDKIRLQKAISELESLSSNDDNGAGDRDKELLLGDWTLVATASLPSSDIRRRFDRGGKKKGGWPFGKKNDGVRRNPIQKSISDSIEVTQRIRSTSSSAIDRVDNVIQFTPVSSLESIIPSASPLFGILSGVNVNPLQVSKSKVVLVHKAEVESVRPVLRTKIAWTSSILNIAGESQLFDPEGADIFGVNNLLGDFVDSSGTFDTPYIDENVRVSRTSGPVLEQLRVFVREGSTVLQDGETIEDLMAETEASSSSHDTSKSQVEKVIEAADSVQKAVTSLAENAKSTIEKDMETVNKALGDTMDDVVSKVQDAVEDDLEQIGKAIGKIQDTDNIGEAVVEVTKAVVKVPSDVRSIVEEDAMELGDRVEEALDSMVADVQDSVEGDLKEIGDAIESVRDAATGGSDEKDDEVAEAEE